MFSLLRYLYHNSRIKIAVRHSIGGHLIINFMLSLTLYKMLPRKPYLVDYTLITSVGKEPTPLYTLLFSIDNKAPILQKKNNPFQFFIRNFQCFTKSRFAESTESAES